MQGCILPVFVELQASVSALSPRTHLCAIVVTGPLSSRFFSRIDFLAVRSVAAPGDSCVFWSLSEADVVGREGLKPHRRSLSSLSTSPFVFLVLGTGPANGPRTL